MTTIVPWLSVADATQAVVYYQEAFGAVEIEHLDDDSGRVAIAQLSIDGATLWVQQDEDSNPKALDGRPPVRMLLVVSDPDAVFAQALACGATQVASMHEEHGWRTGRITDPFGHDWEFSRRLKA
jgi:PhnB protein